MNRIGYGWDSHRFVEGRPLVLAGVKIEHDKGLLGHSDGDAALHALIDALLGAAGLGDIGEHFPDADPRYKDADSALLLTETMSLISQAGWGVVNCDLTVITQAPKMSPHKPALRERIADLVGVDAAQVSVKAKSNEGMGWIGRGEGLAVVAVVMVEQDDT